MKSRITRGLDRLAVAMGTLTVLIVVYAILIGEVDTPSDFAGAGTAVVAGFTLPFLLFRLTVWVYRGFTVESDKEED